MFILMCTLSINIWERVEKALNGMQWEVAYQLIFKVQWCMKVLVRFGGCNKHEKKVTSSCRTKRGPHVFLTQAKGNFQMNSIWGVRHIKCFHSSKCPFRSRVLTKKTVIDYGTRMILMNLSTPPFPSSAFCLLVAPCQAIGSKHLASIPNHLPSKHQAYTNYLSSKYQSTTNQLPINCQSSTNQLPIKHQSTTSQVPINCQSSTDQVPIKYQSTANQLPINCQSSTNNPSIAIPHSFIMYSCNTTFLVHCWYMLVRWLVHCWYLLGRCLVHCWYVLGRWLVHCWYMLGRWLVHCWYLLGRWLVHCWYILGRWLVHSWYLLGRWLTMLAKCFLPIT